MARKKKKARKAKTKTKTRRKAAKRTVKRKKTAVRKTKRKAKRRGGKSGLTQQTYSLSPELQEIVGCSKCTRPQVVKKLWAYIKSKKCQDTKNRRLIVPDGKLAKVLGSRPIDMLKMSGVLNKHIKK